jgi:hypothetical protein
MLSWESPPLSGGYPHAAYRARHGEREFWIRYRQECPDTTFRLLVLENGFLRGAANHPSLASAQRAAEQIDSEACE